MEKQLFCGAARRCVNPYKEVIERISGRDDTFYGNSFRTVKNGIEVPCTVVPHDQEAVRFDLCREL